MKNRLIVLFDSNIPNDLKKDDVIFVYNKSCLDGRNLTNKVIIYNLWEASKDRGPSDIITLILAGCKKDVSIIANTMYSNFFSPLYSFFKQFSKIIQDNNIEEVLLQGGGNFPYITFEKGEGEGKPYKYKHKWLYNPLIYQCLKNSSISVEWRNKSHLSVIYRIHQMLREFYLSFYDVLKEIYNNQIHKSKYSHSFSHINVNEYNAVAFANLEGQYMFLKSLTQQGCLKFLYVTPQRFDKDCINLNGWLSLRDIFANIKACFGLFKTNIDVEIEEYHLYLPFKALKYAIRTEYLIYKNSIGRLKTLGLNLFHKDMKCMVTCTSQGKSMVKYTVLGREFKIKHINCQYVTLGQRYLPIVDLADEYYLFEKGSFEFFKSKSPIFKFYIPQFLNRNHHNKIDKVMVIYTQPDSYTERYLNLLREIGNKRNVFNYTIVVKLHYRQDKVKEFEKLCQSYGFKMIKNELSIKELMLHSDLTVSMTSSVLSESLFYQVPAIIYLEDFSLRKFVIDSNIGYPDVNFIVDNFDSFVERIERLSLSEYKQRLSTYINKNSVVLANQIFK